MVVNNPCVKSILAAGLLTLLSAVGCGKNETVPKVDVATTVISAKPLKASLAVEGPRFESLPAAQTGIAYVNGIHEDSPFSFLYATALSCGGVAIGDVDGDERPDIFFAGQPGQSRLYRQTGDFTFQDITTSSGIQNVDAFGVGATLFDLDNDGDLDLHICYYEAPNRLYINQGKGTFIEEGATRGTAITDASHTAVPCDYDRDGDLDLYLLTNRLYYPGGQPKGEVVAGYQGRAYIKNEYARYFKISKTTPGAQPGTVNYEYDITGRPDYLLRNTGDGHFEDVTQDAGIFGNDHGLSATWWDMDEDGFTDLYVANDFKDPDRLYRNQGDGTFREVSETRLPYTTWFSMGADLGDLNGDGRMDLLVADMSGTSHFKQKTAMGPMSANVEFLTTAIPRQYMRNMLFLNTGTERFQEAAFFAGLDSTDWTWSVKLCDFDNDAKVDAYFSNGFTRNFNESDIPAALEGRRDENLWERHKRAGTPRLNEHNLAYKNMGGMKFSPVGKTWGLDRFGVSYASAHSDLDRDGDLDLVVINLDEPASVYRNQSAGAHRVLIRLRDPNGRDAIGAKVKLQTASGRQVRELTIVRGYAACNEALVHFGLGGDDRIRALTIAWPNGGFDRFEDLAADQFYTITQGNESGPDAPTAAPTQPLFTAREFPVADPHEENETNDYQHQPLLPGSLSRFGPGIAVADANGDGKLDLYLGGAKGGVGQLLLGSESGFESGSPLPWAKDGMAEDFGVLFFDVENDGDLDLYVASGGYEYAVGDERLRDRLYLNNAAGSFHRAELDALPDLRQCSSVVAAADPDRDGDLDLFVGSRVMARQYPLSPPSALLRNDSRQGVPRLVDATFSMAPDLEHSGLVTSAVWSDVDADGWVDLMVTHEWGPVKLYRNQQGTLEDATAAAGLADRTGFWNSISAGDFDGDQDIDFVVGNLGLNTKYHGSAEHPVLLYYGDFEGTGEPHLVEAEYEDQTLFPIRGRSCSSTAMPSIGKTFDSYKSFALASLQDIYSEQELNQAHRFAATELASGILLNDGKGHFTFMPLPTEAQYAPVFGIVVGDFTPDAHPDIVLVQNFYDAQPETGRMAGGLGLLLAGQGDGTFTSVPPIESGLVIPENARSLTLAGNDLIVGVNDGAFRRFEHLGSDTTVVLGPELRVGSRVIITQQSGRVRVREVYTGGGYLSQQAAQIRLHVASDDPITSIELKYGDDVKRFEPATGIGRILLQ